MDECGAQKKLALGLAELLVTLSSPGTSQGPHISTKCYFVAVRCSHKDESANVTKPELSASRASNSANLEFHIRTLFEFQGDRPLAADSWTALNTSFRSFRGLLNAPPAKRSHIPHPTAKH